MKTDWLNSVLQLMREIESGDCLVLEPDRDKEEKEEDEKVGGVRKAFYEGKDEGRLVVYLSGR